MLRALPRVEQLSSISSNYRTIFFVLFLVGIFSLMKGAFRMVSVRWATDLTITFERRGEIERRRNFLFTGDSIFGV